MDILKLKTGDRGELLTLYRAVTESLRKREIRQWDRFYPNRFIIRQDLGEGCLYGIREEDRIIAAVSVNQAQSKRYKPIPWADVAGHPAVIHCLAVHPGYQGKGLGKRMLQFAENLAQSGGFSSIRLDVCSANPAAVSMYERHGYIHRGVVHFPFRKAPYYCMEKVIQYGI